jgi:hypothetical protein
MQQEPNEQTQGNSGEHVKFAGQYAAVGCCRDMKKPAKGDIFPGCPKHGSTTWGWIPPGAAINLGDAD